VREAYLLATKVGISDPLDLPCAVFDQFLTLLGRGEVIRAGADADPCRSYVDRVMAQGG